MKKDNNCKDKHTTVSDGKISAIVQNMEKMISFCDSQPTIQVQYSVQIQVHLRSYCLCLHYYLDHELQEPFPGYTCIHSLFFSIQYHSFLLSQCVHCYIGSRGWFTVLIFSWEPRMENSSLKKVAVNLGSLSDILSPCTENTWSMYTRAAPSAVIVDFVGIRWVYFVNLSTNVKIALCPFSVSGSPTIRSILISAHGRSGNGKGCKKTCLSFSWLIWLAWLAG